MVSTPWTLTLKLLLPTFWFCFVGGLTLLLLFNPLDDVVLPFSPNITRLLMFTILLCSIGIYYWVFYPIKWVAIDGEKIYVSNFSKSFQYTFDSISKVEEKKILLWKQVTIHFHTSGQFGDKVVFLSSYFWHYYLKKHPEVLLKFLQLEKA